MAKITTEPENTSEDLVKVIATKDGFNSRTGAFIEKGETFLVPASRADKGSWWERYEESTETPTTTDTTISASDVDDTFSALAKKEANPKGKNWR